jgi:hypothetical protein
MQQRQPRLGDILDDYCPRERRLTNHAVVAMIGADIKQTRCTTCDAEHEYKHAKVPRQRRKVDTPPALFAQVAAAAPKRIVPESHDEETAPADIPPVTEHETLSEAAHAAGQSSDQPILSHDAEPEESDADGDAADTERDDEGPVHRPLIRASLPRPDGQPPAARPAPDFTIRQPGGGRPNRFRPRHFQQGGGQPFRGHRSNGNVGGSPIRGGGGAAPRLGRRNGPGRKRSK